MRATTTTDSLEKAHLLGIGKTALNDMSFGDYRYIGYSLRCLSTDGEGSVRSGNVHLTQPDMHTLGFESRYWSQTASSELDKAYALAYNSLMYFALAGDRPIARSLRCLSTDGEGSTFPFKLSSLGVVIPLRFCYSRGKSGLYQFNFSVSRQ